MCVDSCLVPFHFWGIGYLGELESGLVNTRETLQQPPADKERESVCDYKVEDDLKNWGDRFEVIQLGLSELSKNRDARVI